jgi:membrane associated rhomboid family serine protease
VMRSGIGFLIVFNLIFSFAVPNISVGAHIGGLVGGALAGLSFRLAEGRRALALGLAACLALSVVAVIGALAAAQSTAMGIV